MLKHNITLCLNNAKFGARLKPDERQKINQLKNRSQIVILLMCSTGNQKIDISQLIAAQIIQNNAF